MELYDNIRKRRKELKMTQEELASLTGYSDRSSIAKIESGCIDLNVSKIKEFAKALNTTPGELMGNDGINDFTNFDTFIEDNFAYNVSFIKTPNFEVLKALPLDIDKYPPSLQFYYTSAMSKTLFEQNKQPQILKDSVSKIVLNYSPRSGMYRRGSDENRVFDEYTLRKNIYINLLAGYTRSLIMASSDLKQCSYIFEEAKNLDISNSSIEFLENGKRLFSKFINV